MFFTVHQPFLPNATVQNDSSRSGYRAVITPGVFVRNSHCRMHASCCHFDILGLMQILWMHVLNSYNLSAFTRTWKIVWLHLLFFPSWFSLVTIRSLPFSAALNAYTCVQECLTPSFMETPKLDLCAITIIPCWRLAFLITRSVIIALNSSTTGNDTTAPGVEIALFVSLRFELFCFAFLLNWQFALLITRYLPIAIALNGSTRDHGTLVTAPGVLLLHCLCH